MTSHHHSRSHSSSHTHTQVISTILVADALALEKEKRKRKEEKEKTKKKGAEQKAFPGVRLNVLPNDKDWSQDGCSIFGRPIPRRSSTLTPFLLSTIKWLEKNALTTEGLFRVTASNAEVEGLMALLERGTTMKQINLDVYKLKPNVVSTILKKYFREIPEPLMGFELYYAYIEVRKSQIVDDLAELLNKLDTGKLVHMKFLMRFLFRVHEHSNINKMTAENLAIVFGPSLLRAPHELDPEIVLRNCGIANIIIATMIVQYQTIFEEKLRDRFMGDAIDPEVHSNGRTSIRRPPLSTCSSSPILPLAPSVWKRWKPSSSETNDSSSSSSTLSSSSIPSSLPLEPSLLSDIDSNARRPASSSLPQEVVVNSSSSFSSPSTRSAWSEGRIRNSFLMQDATLYPKNQMTFCSSFISEGDFIELPWL